MQRIFLTALVAGTIAGFAAFAVQAAKLSPLILEAEVYEEAAAAKEEASETQAHEGHEHEAEAWEPANGFERNAYRALADIGVGVGFAFLLTGAFVLYGGPMNASRGLLWGLAGYAVFALAPGFGLPPELPGSLAADLASRQMWWLATAAATAIGLGLLAFNRSPLFRALGVVLLALPQVIGAPHPDTIGGAAPTELSAQFASASLATAAIFWIVLGTASGWFYGRQTKSLA